MRRNLLTVAVLALAFAAGFGLRGLMTVTPVHAQASGRVFEIRTYTANDGKLADLHARFRNHTHRMFTKHGMTNVVYFAPEDPPLSQNTLIYVLAHPSREAAVRNWEAFRKDPEWQKVLADTEVNGRFVSKVESVFA